MASIVRHVGAALVVGCGVEGPGADLTLPTEPGVLGASAAGKRPGTVAVAVLGRADELAWAVNGLFDASFDRSDLVVVVPAPTDPTASRALDALVAAADLTYVAVAGDGPLEPEVSAALTARPAIVVVGTTTGVGRRRPGLPLPPPPAATEVAALAARVDAAEGVTLVVGQGAAEALDAVHRLTRAVGAVVVTTMPMTGTCDDLVDHYAGRLGQSGHRSATAAVTTTDLVVRLGMLEPGRAVPGAHVGAAGDDRPRPVSPRLRARGDRPPGRRRRSR